MKDVLSAIALIVVTTSVIYGMYWVAKTVSYNMFYEDMVVESIKESVKKSCIKENK